MATRIVISKALEKGLREGGNLPVLVDRVVALIDAAQTAQASKASVSGLSAQAFIAAVEANKPITKPPAGPLAGKVYARLTRVLRENAITEDQATALGVWMSGQAWLRDVTIDRLIANLSDWLTRAVATRPEWCKPEW